MYRWSISEVRHRIIDALKERDAAYLKYIHNDGCGLDYLFNARDNRWALDEANKKVANLRAVLKEVTLP